MSKENIGRIYSRKRFLLKQQFDSSKDGKDINVKKDSKAVGVYYTALNGDKSSPSWDLPVDANLLNILGSIQTAIGVILILLVVFRSRLLKSFQNR